MRPRLLLCDEPTGNLDSATAAGILDLFSELHAQGQALVMITHSSEVAARAERKLEMNDGVVSEA
jgi:putative ABC transport system ATP-binding protein